MNGSPTRYFKVSNFTIQLSSHKSIELMCTSVTLPGFEIGESSISRPVVHDRRPGEHLTYNDLQLTFIVDEKFEAWKEIHDAIILNADPDTAELTVNQTIFDAQLFLTTNKNNIQHSIVFKYCWIKSVGDIILQSTTTEDEHLTCNLNLVYSYYNFI